MKKIDRLLISNFIPPFLVTFGIATFVLLMQILWVYIDDIAGKGLGGLVIAELLAYKCVGLVPMALPLAILISGVMVMGGLAEHYELSSFKSAGVSLIRVMRPIMYFGFLAMIVSYLCNDYVIPVANLNFGSRMYDIQEKKPTLSLEAGIFNDDFGNFSIYIGDKDPDGISISDVLIYDHTLANSNKLSQVVAEHGQMASSKDGDFLIMKLFNGHQYVETRPTRAKKNSNQTFVRTSFESWNKVFDLTEFDMAVTTMDLFKQNRSMMGISQLETRIDTIQQEIDDRYLNLGRQVGGHFLAIPIDSLYPKIIETRPSPELDDPEFRDSSLYDSELEESDSSSSLGLRAKFIRDSISAETRAKAIGTTKSRKPTIRKSPILPKAGQVFEKEKETETKLIPIERFLAKEQNIDIWLDSLSKTEKRRFITKAKSTARAILSQATSAEKTIDRTRENKVKHIYEMHTKYSMAVVCLIFVFIGAPLGAIVRKGGFGYPLLVSVVAFIVFIVLTIFCRKIAETFIVPADLAAWLPCIILAPIGLWLTLKARSDSQLLDLSWFKKLGRFIPSKKKDLSPE